MGNSYFKGLVPSLPQQQSSPTSGGSSEVFVGHVLEVFYDPMEGNSRGLSVQPGDIRVKILGLDNKEDDKVVTIASPADINMVKYPLPGEIVFLLQGLAPFMSDKRIITRFYYIHAITASKSVTFNSNPFYSTLETSKTVNDIVTPEYKTRFERKMRNLESFKNVVGDNTVKQRRSLRPFEGDFIIQSRFGSSIRMGSTGINDKSPVNGEYLNDWSKNGGISGNPITIISADRKQTADAVIEDVNKEDSSIYVCTTQVIPILLSTSKDLKSYRYTYNTVSGDTITASLDKTTFVESADDELQYQQPGVAANLSNVPLVLEGTIKQIVDAIPDTLLDPVTGCKNNRNQNADLVWINTAQVLLERNTAKAVIALLRAALEAGVPLRITSGYRPQFGPNTTVKSKNNVNIKLTTQETLRRDRSRWSAAERSKFPNDDAFVLTARSSAFNPQTAPPGKSLHGDGIAVDFGIGSRKTTSFGTLNGAAYSWLIRNAHKYGFIRTVSTEEWHFEFRPGQATGGPYAGIAGALKDPAARPKLLFYADLKLDKLT